MCLGENSTRLQCGGRVKQGAVECCCPDRKEIQNGFGQYGWLQETQSAGRIEQLRHIRLKEIKRPGLEKEERAEHRSKRRNPQRKHQVRLVWHLDQIESGLKFA